MIVPPEEIRDLWSVFEPYLEGCHLSKDAPKNVVKAYEECME